MWTAEPTETDEPEVVADFETAIEACNFGLYNVFLLLAAVPAVASTIFETSSMSYIIPVAECDLDLTLNRKGILNAMGYAGMIVSAVPWGYVADTMGRKKVLVYGLWIHGILVLCTSVSQNPNQLMAFKFFSGFVNCGPFATIMSYLSEFHGKKHRSTVILIIGLMLTTATLILPILAYLLLQHIYEFSILGLDLHTWHVFLAITAIPSFLGSSLLALFPESPKFLMYQGKNDEALKVFQRMYTVNTGKPTFQFLALFEESPEKTAKRKAENSEKSGTRESIRQAKVFFIEGLQQITPLFSKPFFGLSLLVYLMYFCVLTSQNTIRLWLPQMFATLAELEKTDAESLGMCDILAHNVNKTIKADGYLHCYIHASASSYNKNIIAAAANMAGFIVTSILVNIIGTHYILKIVLTFSCVSGYALYWSKSPLSVLILTSIFNLSGGIASTTILGVSVGIFPTGMRTLVLLIVLTFGRSGSLLGNIAFPRLMPYGCIPTCVIIAGLTSTAFLLSFFLPNTHKTALK